MAPFVREYKKDGFGLTAPLCLLGLVDYRSHEGERPMSIVWRPGEPVSARYLPKTNKLAGWRRHAFRQTDLLVPHTKGRDWVY